MHILPPLLFLVIPRRGGRNLPHTSSNATLHTLTPIPNLTLRLCFLSSLVLLLACLPQSIVANQVTQRLLCRSDGLVPAAVVALRVVGCCGTGGWVCGDGADLGGGVAGIVLGFAGRLGGFAGGLWV